MLIRTFLVMFDEVKTNVQIFPNVLGSAPYMVFIITNTKKFNEAYIKNASVTQKVKECKMFLLSKSSINLRNTKIESTM